MGSSGRIAKSKTIAQFAPMKTTGFWIRALAILKKPRVVPRSPNRRASAVRWNLSCGMIPKIARWRDGSDSLP
jgi:hypothetical protein